MSGRSRRDPPQVATQKQQQIARVAIRHEGEFINAYFADPRTMEDSVLVGSIRTSICDTDPAVFELFQELMRASMSALFKEVLGKAPDFVIEPAPEHEKAGHS